MKRKRSPRAEADKADPRRFVTPTNGSDIQRQHLCALVRHHGLSLALGDVQLLSGKWYVTHGGLLRLAARHRCNGIHTEPVYQFCDPCVRRWVVKATVYKNSGSKGFIGYGDADPSNVSELVRGAEMRVAETRAVNRALRKAYGVGLCSVDEIGPSSNSSSERQRRRVSIKAPCACVVPSANGDGERPRLRDRLRQLIRQHQLDPILVKSYAVDFCGVKTLADASREQIQKLIDHLARRATTDREGLATDLNRYAQLQERAS